MKRSLVLILAGSLALTLVATRSEADLGCATNSPGNFPPTYSTCTQSSDCAPVGGSDCTSDICFCPNGNLNPFCACLATGLTHGAPALTGAGLIGLAGVLCAVGLLGVWRRTGSHRKLA